MKNFKPYFKLANTYSPQDKEKVKKALAEMRKFLKMKKNEANNLKILVRFEREKIAILSHALKSLDEKQSKLSYQMIETMIEANRNSQAILENLFSYLSLYLAFCDKREAFLNGKMPRKSYNEFVRGNNQKRSKTAKKIEAQIKKILHFDKKVKEIYLKLEESLSSY